MDTHFSEISDSRLIVRLHSFEVLNSDQILTILQWRPPLSEMFFITQPHILS